MDRNDFEKWMQGYLACWASNDPEAIGALFAEDAEYYTQAFRESWRGRDMIVKEWIGRADWQGEPGDEWTFDYHWVAVEGDTGVLEGQTNYSGRNEVIHNIWFITLDAAGRCRVFKETWVQKPEA